MKKNISKFSNLPKYDLKYFIFKTNTLLLYREIYKFCFNIQNIPAREEMRKYLRAEVDRDSKLEYNEKNSEYKLGVARKKINQLKIQIEMMM